MGSDRLVVVRQRLCVPLLHLSQLLSVQHLLLAEERLPTSTTTSTTTAAATGAAVAGAAGAATTFAAGARPPAPVPSRRYRSQRRNGEALALAAAEPSYVFDVVYLRPACLPRVHHLRCPTRPHG